MGAFFAKYKIILISVTAILVIFIGYGIMKKPSESGGTVSITTANGQPNGTLPSGPQPGDEFIGQLLAIQNINFHTEFFDDPVYKELKDQARPLGERPIGRPNPFYPIGIDPGQIVEGNASSSASGFSLTSTTTTPAGTSAGTRSATSSARTTAPRR